MSYRSVLNVSNGGPSNPKLTLKINSFRIKLKVQNFASWVLSEQAFKIGRKKGNDFLIIVPLYTNLKPTNLTNKRRNETDLMTDDKLYTSLSANSIMAKVTNHFQRTRLITSSTDKHYSLLKMTSAQVVETSLTNNSPFQLHHEVHNMSKKPLGLFWQFRPSTSQ